MMISDATTDYMKIRTSNKFFNTNMGSEDTVPLANESNVEAEPSIGRSSPCKKHKGKVPKRIHKAVREKQKREHLNELFMELSCALDLDQPNNGKASILCEAARLLKDLLSQIELLSKENASLLSESNYVTAEKNELKEDNLNLETQIEKLQGELRGRMVWYKPDLNVPPSMEYKQPELASHFFRDCLAMPAPFAVPTHPLPDSTLKPTSQVSKPHARYATSMDRWPSQLLGEQQQADKDSLVIDNNSIDSKSENGLDNM